MAALILRTFSRSLLSTQQQGHRLIGVRYILTNRMLKCDVFMEKKQAISYHIQNKDLYFETIQKKFQNSEVIQENELTPMFYLCETESDVQLVKKCLLRFYEETETVKYKFGPLLLRVCYVLDLVDTAFELLMDKSFRGALSDPVSYNLLLDLLYKHGQYERALEALLDMKIQCFRLNRITYFLAFAICYKLDNPRSLETCITLFEQSVMDGILHSRISLCFIVALALKQGDYGTAWSIFQRIEKKDILLCYNLGLLLAASLKNEEEVMQILETESETASFNSLKVQFSKEVMDAVQEKLHHTGSFTKFKEMYEKLGHSGQICTLTLDDLLHTTADLVEKQHKKMQGVASNNTL